MFARMIATLWFDIDNSPTSSLGIMNWHTSVYGDLDYLHPFLAGIPVGIIGVFWSGGSSVLLNSARDFIESRLSGLLSVEIHDVDSSSSFPAHFGR